MKPKVCLCTFYLAYHKDVPENMSFRQAHSVGCQGTSSHTPGNSSRHGAGGPPATDSGGSMDPGSGSDRITNGSDVFGLLFTRYYQSGLSDRDKNLYPGPTLHQNFNI